MGICSIETAPGIVQEGSIYSSLQEAIDTVLTYQLRFGHIWQRAQSKNNNGTLCKLTVRCNHYNFTAPTHWPDLDPSEYCTSKTNQTGCMAFVNLCRISVSNSWRVTKLDWVHNHDPEVPPSGKAPRRATKQEKQTISQLATSNSQQFLRAHIAVALQAQNTDNPKFSVLEPRQINNLINNAQREAHEEINSHGGNIQAIIDSLNAKNLESPGWAYHLKLNENSIMTGIWWQSPMQADLAKRYGDVLINDNTYNWNNTGYPLNIGIIIDGHGHSHNIWYALHQLENHAHHSWALGCHLTSAGYPPTTFMSDHHASLISAVIEKLPMTEHIFCIHHLSGNIELNIRRLISGQWADFSVDFWDAYRAVSPEEFDRLWTALVDKFPETRTYLDGELYSCHTQWAWAFISHKFTCGVRTNGRVESENRVNKVIGGAEKINQATVRWSK